MLVEQMNKNTVKPQRGDILVGGNYDFGENMYSFQHITPLGFSGILFIPFLPIYHPSAVCRLDSYILATNI
jgi:hypothetical protein